MDNRFVKPFSITVDNILRVKTARRNVALEVEGLKLWICPAQLASHSEVFENLFFGNFSERDKEVIPFKEEKLEYFETFLMCLSKLMFTGDYVEMSHHFNTLMGVWKLPDKYLVEELKLGLEVEMDRRLWGMWRRRSLPERQKRELIDAVNIFYTNRGESSAVFNTLREVITEFKFKHILKLRKVLDDDVFEILTNRKIEKCEKGLCRRGDTSDTDDDSE